MFAQFPGKKLTKHTVDEKSVAKISVKVLEAVNNAKIVS